MSKRTLKKKTRSAVCLKPHLFLDGGRWYAVWFSLHRPPLYGGNSPIDAYRTFSRYIDHSHYLTDRGREMRAAVIGE